LTDERALPRVAVVTGASSGIGSATAVALARAGFRVVIGARRLDALAEIAAQFDGTALALDVTQTSSVDAFAGAIDHADVLVNNAGLAVGRDPIAELSDEAIYTMWQTNVAGLLRVTRALLPRLTESTQGHIVNVGSVGGFEVYPSGGGYTLTKHAVRAITRTLRLELLDAGIRVTEVAPGLVKTDFSLVRYAGDAERAAKTYEGIASLAAEDVADCIVWAVTRPPHVNVDEIVVRPTAQATTGVVKRKV
jgi:NADP-dependent 3-hydroxy acid dehydrogenase YdfG